MSSACDFIFMQVKVIFIRMISHLDSLWNRGTRELGNDLLLPLRVGDSPLLPLKINTLGPGPRKRWLVTIVPTGQWQPSWRINGRHESHVGNIHRFRLQVVLETVLCRKLFLIYRAGSCLIFGREFCTLVGSFWKLFLVRILSSLLLGTHCDESAILNRRIGSTASSEYPTFGKDTKREQTGSTKTKTMAINRLEDHTGGKKTLN